MTIKHLFHIKSLRENVYRELATVEGLSHWWTVTTGGESRVDGILTFRFGEHEGPKLKVTKLVEGKEVAWECVEGPSDWMGTEIRFALDENEGKTRVRFSHSGWKDDSDGFASSSFSWVRYLESLRQYCQTGKGEAFGSPGYRK